MSPRAGVRLSTTSARLVATVDSTNLITERDENNNRVESFSSFEFA